MYMYARFILPKLDVIRVALVKFALDKSSECQIKSVKEFSSNLYRFLSFRTILELTITKDKESPHD